MQASTDGGAMAPVGKTPPPTDSKLKEIPPHLRAKHRRMKSNAAAVNTSPGSEQIATSANVTPATQKASPKALFEKEPPRQDRIATNAVTTSETVNNPTDDSVKVKETHGGTAPPQNTHSNDPARNLSNIHPCRDERTLPAESLTPFKGGPTETPDVLDDALSTAANATDHLGEEPSTRPASAAAATPPNITLREKLSKHGVKVGSPQPASGPLPADWPVFFDDFAHLGTHKTSSRQRGLHVGPRNDAQPGPSRGSENLRTNRGVTQGARGSRECGWVKNKDMPRTDPKRFDVVSEDWLSNASVADSESAGSALEMGKRADIDNETGFKLADWDGKWAPAPVDWDARPAFRPNQSAQKIETWMDKIEAEMDGRPWLVPVTKIKRTNGQMLVFAPKPGDPSMTIQGDPAPHYWIPAIMEMQSPSKFWVKFVESKEPEPFQEDDLLGVLPWWECYEVAGNANCHFLQPYNAPPVKPDPGETEDERLKRENDFGSANHTENRKRYERAKHSAKVQRQTREARESALRSRLAAKPNMLQPGRINPSVHLYIRMALPADNKEICHIYNHYVENSISTPEMFRCDDENIQLRIAGIRQNKLPFLVACLQGARVRSRNGDVMHLPHEIVGFAFADDYNDPRAMYRFAVEVEVYTRKDMLLKGIAKCLLDKLVGLLDPGFMQRGGYRTQGDDVSGFGGERLVRQLIVHLPYEISGCLDWVTRWLERGYGFKNVGDLRDVGVKLGKSVHLAMFQRTCSTRLDPANPPVMM